MLKKNFAEYLAKNAAAIAAMPSGYYEIGYDDGQVSIVYGGIDSNGEDNAVKSFLKGHPYAEIYTIEPMSIKNAFNADCDL